MRCWWDGCEGLVAGKVILGVRIGLLPPRAWFWDFLPREVKGEGSDC